MKTRLSLLRVLALLSMLQVSWPGQPADNVAAAAQPPPLPTPTPARLPPNRG